MTNNLQINIRYLLLGKVNILGYQMFKFFYTYYNISVFRKKYDFKNGKI